MKTLAATLALLVLFAFSAHAEDTVVISTPETDNDRHAGYYYPEPDSFERYIARAKRIAQASRAMRVEFITSLEVALAKRGSPVPFAVFAKGAQAQKMIIVALTDGPLDTLYRARAVLANLTAESRMLPILTENGVDDWFTFFDLAVLVGFEQLTITDGKTWAHQIQLAQPY